MKIKREKPKRSLSRRLVLAVDALMNHILLLLAALVFLFGFYALWDANQVYSQASSSEYEAYRPVSTSEKDELASFSGFHKLQQVNPEVLGWINVYGTNIDYPLVQAKDNEKYLNKDSKGEFAATGAIFLEARNESKFEDFNTIIYGHHVENGVMFGDVAKFSDKEFFDQHRYGSIYY
ncbi:MAG: class B sortase, partial [Streptococcus sp.]|nr:class B sortase [Streptococcus sp.]